MLSKVVEKARYLVSSTSAHPFVSAALIFAVSFSIRLLMLLNAGNIAWRAEAENVALTLASKHQFADPFALATGPTAHTTPFYPLLVAGVYALFGHGYLGFLVRSTINIAAYSLLYAAYVWLAPAFGFPREVGFLAGLASALLPVRRSAEVFRGWEEPYAALALAIVLLLTLRQWSNPDRKLKTPILLGLCWGLALYISVSLASVLVGLTCLYVVTFPSWKSIRDSFCTILTVVVIISPWIVRNRIELHGWTFMRTGFGENLWCSNNDHAQPSIELINRDPVARDMYPISSREEAMKIRQLGEVAYDRSELRLAVQWIRQHPRRFARLSVQRFLYFWAGPQEHPYEWIVTTIYTALGLLGLIFMRRRVGAVQWRIWITVFVCYPTMYYFVQYVNRYRTPIDWMIWFSAGLAVSELFGASSLNISPGESFAAQSVTPQPL